jgi:serine/threonine protein kinase/tetratricopeptide (TPR) repeat protein
MSADNSTAGSGPDRDPVERLAEEFLNRRRRGESPSISDYVSRHPEWGERIRSLFPMLMLLEQIKTDSDPSHRTGQESATASHGRLPTRLGDYRIVREIGRGGMGVVYEAEQESLGRRVALKVLPSHCMASPSRLRRFHREARAAARLHHTNIVPIFGIGRQGDVYYYVMQYIPGQGLDRVFGQPTLNPTTVWSRHCVQDVLTNADDEHLPDESAPTTPPSVREASDPVSSATEQQPAYITSGPYYWRTVADIGRQVAEALEYAHQHGVLHRDIKPGNLLLDNQGTVWVADFGLAKLPDMDDPSQSEDMVGTLRYMAPEQFAGQGDARSDVYSLGLTLYELLALRPAFDERDRQSLIRQVTQEEPPLLRTVLPSLPRDLETIVSKAIDVHPAHRYRTAGDLAADLRCFLDDRPIQARRITAVERLWRWCRRNRAIAALTGLAAVLLLAVAVVASVGYVRTSEALYRVSYEREQAENARLLAEDQRERAQVEHERAETNLHLATKAFEDIFNHLGANPLGQVAYEDDEQTTDPAADSSFTDKDATLLESMLKFYDQFAQRNSRDVRLRTETAAAYRRVGDIQRRLGQYTKAETAYRRAVTLYQSVDPASPHSAESLTALAAIDNELGVVYRRLGRYAEARESHQHALEVLRSQPAQVAAQTDNRYELARTYGFLSYVYSGRIGDRLSNRQARPPSPRSAENVEYNRHALEILAKLIGEDPQNPLYRLTMARCQRDRCFLAAFGGLADESHQARLEAVDILEQLVRDFPSHPDYRYELADTYAAAAYRSRDDETEAADSYRRAIEIADDLVAQYPALPEYKLLLARIHSRFADFLRSISSDEDAVVHLRRAVDLNRSMIAEFSHVEIHQFRLAWNLRQLAEAELAVGRKDKARALLNESLGVVEAVAKNSTNSSSSMMLGMQYRMLSRTFRDLGDQAQADQLEAKAGPLPDWTRSSGSASNRSPDVQRSTNGTPSIQKDETKEAPATMPD